MSVELPKVMDILSAARSSRLVAWAVGYGCVFHPQAADKIALAACEAAARDRSLAATVASALGTTFGAWQSEPRVGTELRKLAAELAPPALAEVAKLVAMQQRDSARDFVVGQLDNADPARAAAVVGALRFLSDGREILAGRLARSPRPEYPLEEVQQVLLAIPGWNEASLRLALETLAETPLSRSRDDACPGGIPAALGAGEYLCAAAFDRPEDWEKPLVAECAPVLDRVEARCVAGLLRNGKDVAAAEAMLARVPAGWLEPPAGDCGQAGLARALLGLVAKDRRLRDALGRRRGGGLCRLIAVCIARVLDEELPRPGDPSSASLEEAVRVLGSRRPRIHDEEAWLARTASFGGEALRPLEALAKAGPYHAARRAARAIAKIGTTDAARSLVAMADGDGESSELAAELLDEMPRAALAPLDANSLEHAVAHRDWHSAASVLDRWSEPHVEAEPVALAALSHFESLAESEARDALAELVVSNPLPGFVPPVLETWRRGEIWLGTMAEVLLAVHRPADPRLEEVSRDLDELTGARRFQETLAGQFVTLRLRCRRCGSSYSYDVRHVLVTGALTKNKPLPAREFAIIDEAIKCKRCGAIDEYEWTEEADRTLVLAAVLAIGGSARGRSSGVFTYKHVRSVVGEDLPASELITRLERQLADSPDDPGRHLGLGNAYLSLRQLDKAEAVYARMLSRWPDNAEAAYWHGCALERQERLQEALDAFSRAAVCLAPATPDARAMARNIGVALRELPRRVGRAVPIELLDRLARLAESLPPEEPERENESEEADEADQPARAARAREPEGPAPAVRKKTPGRNEPCPCGSGRKYKKCCGRTADGTPGGVADDPVRRVSMGLRNQLIRELKQLLPREELGLAMSRWTGAPPGSPFVGDGEDAMLFEEYLLFDWRPEGGSGRTVLERFAEKEGGRLTAGERAQVDAWLARRRRGWFEVESADPAKGLMVLKDRIDGDMSTVYDRTLSARFQRGSMFLGPVLPVGDRLEIGSAVMLIPRYLRRTFEAWLRREQSSWSAARAVGGRDSSWRAFFSDRAPEIARELRRLVGIPPRVLLPTGEELSPGRAIYEVLDRRAALEALESASELHYSGWTAGEHVEGDSYDWVWRRDGPELPFQRPISPGEGEVGGVPQIVVLESRTGYSPEGGRPGQASSREEIVGTVRLGVHELEISALSRERLDFLRAELARRLGGDILERRVEQAPADYGKRIWQSAPEPLERSARAQRTPQGLERELLTGKAIEWLDRPLPMLRGRTPREAAADGELRGELEDVLRDIEERERTAPGGGSAGGLALLARRELGMP